MIKSIYLDSAASALKSKSVINAQIDFLENHYANAGRGTCARANAVSDMLSLARQKTAQFIGAKPENIIFTSGATDSLNRIANMMPFDAKVVVSDLDHHSARLPFEQKNKTIICSLDDDFNLSSNKLAEICKKNNVYAVVITAMSNVLGTAQNVKNLIDTIKKIDDKIITIIDATQFAVYLPIDVSDWNCDALVFSGHKIGADTGLGVLYLKNPENWNTDKFGGGMVNSVILNPDSVVSKINYADGPARFETGTLPLTQISGLITALPEIKTNGQPDLIKYLYGELSKIKRIKILSKPDAMVISFVVRDMHCFDFGVRVAAHGVCLRVGTMCASWLHTVMGYNSGTIRVSCGKWNTMHEIEEFIKILNKILKV